MAYRDHRAAWDRGEFVVVATGAMCAPATFRLEDGREARPFAVSPWDAEQDPRFDDLPPLLKRLRGDWLCLPFGMPEARSDLPADWAPAPAAGRGLDAYFHGPSANLDYRLTAEAPGLMEFTLDYPDGHPIGHVRRAVRGVPQRARLEFDLEVHARETVTLPVGVHPVFRLPNTPGAAELVVAGDIRVHTYPVDAEPGVSRLAHGRTATGLDAVPLLDGTRLDLSRLPLSMATEEIVLVSGVAGQAHLINHEERYRVSLTWDPEAFPCCNLWISNRGRVAYPWNGRHLAVGIEPVAAPFDLGVGVARSAATPLARAGVRTAATFRAGQVWSTTYAIEVFAL